MSGVMSAYDYAIEAGIGPNIAVRFADWHAAYFPESDVRHAWHAWTDAFPYLTKGVASATPVRHAYVPDGRRGFDEGICVASGNTGMCGRRREEHHR